MLKELWINIIKYLTREELEILILLKIVSKNYICKICQLNRKLVLQNKIYCKEVVYIPNFCNFKDIKHTCGLYINNICTKCCHVNKSKIKATNNKLKNYKKSKYIHQIYWINRCNKKN